LGERLGVGVGETTASDIISAEEVAGGGRISGCDSSLLRTSKSMLLWARYPA